MGRTVATGSQTSPLLCRESATSEIAKVPAAAMVKASLPRLSEREKKAGFGLILRRASQLARLSRKETADALGVDEGQLGRWWSGDETPQVFRYMANPIMRAALRIAEAEDAEAAGEDVVVRTVIEVGRRKSA